MRVLLTVILHRAWCNYAVSQMLPGYVFPKDKIALGAQLFRGFRGTALGKMAFVAKICIRASSLPPTQVAHLQYYIQLYTYLCIHVCVIQRHHDKGSTAALQH